MVLFTLVSLIHNQSQLFVAFVRVQNPQLALGKKGNRIKLPETETEPKLNRNSQISEWFLNFYILITGTEPKNRTGTRISEKTSIHFLI